MTTPPTPHPTDPPAPGARSFADWMAQALYDPRRGYYTRHIRRLGRGGDFATSATLGHRLARSVAAWIVAEHGVHRQRPRQLIEIGPGDGSLAHGVLRELARQHRWRPWRRPRWQLHLVDVAGPLREAQQHRLRRHRHRVRWHNHPADALRAAGGGALIWSNELIDAFPARVLRWDAARGGWQELWVEMDARGLRESWRPPDPGLAHGDASALNPAAWPGGSPADGQRIEVHDQARRWLGEWLPLWRVGSLLTIDYGDTFPALYHRRPNGTLRAYAHQQRLEGAAIYHRMGRQDLTADVNFTDLQTWTEAAGVETCGLLTQAAFGDRFDGDPAPEPVRAAEQEFRVLWQRRDPDKMAPAWRRKMFRPG